MRRFHLPIHLVAQTAYLVGRRLGPPAEALLFESTAGGAIVIEDLAADDLPRTSYNQRPSVDRARLKR